MGTDIVTYDIYGPDALIPNKMESDGIKGFVHVSKETKAFLEQDYDDLFNFEQYTTIDLQYLIGKNSKMFSTIIHNTQIYDFKKLIRLMTYHSFFRKTILELYEISLTGFKEIFYYKIKIINKIKNAWKSQTRQNQIQFYLI